MSSKLFNINPEKPKNQREIGKNGVEAEFVKAMKKQGWRAYKFTSEMNRGVSDRLVTTPGQVWFVEIKRDNGKLTPLQESFKKHCLDNNLNHFVVYGVKDVPKFIEEVKLNESKNF